jgi:hypothetical protein
MRSVVTGVAKALVEQVAERTRGGGGPPLRGRTLGLPKESHEATPSGAATTRW